MTGPEHYKEAERLIELANEVGHEDPARGEGIIAVAQVHASLAIAAATAAGQATEYDGDETHARARGWAGVA